MKFDIITLFPDMFQGPFAMSMMKKAQDIEAIEINLIDLRQYGLGPRRQVDDTPYGGGDGMVLKPEPVVAAIEAAKGNSENTKVILLTPQGETFKQMEAVELAGKENHLILVCGHYEGFDERIRNFADMQLSIGDYVLTGGELPAMVVVDAVSRLLPDVLGGEESLKEESFNDGKTLEYPQYTRPAEFRGMEVPDVLLSGHHGDIERWRREQALRKTAKVDDEE